MCASARLPSHTSPEMVAAEFSLPGGVGFCNAVRRALLHDVEAWAPCDVLVRVNTSCQTDEFLAHRIGLVPFRRCDAGAGGDGGDGGESSLELQVAGPGTAYARDLKGPGFEPVEGGVPLMVLGEGQALDLTVRFDRQPASVHARYAMCAAVGMGYDDAACRLRFETLDGRAPQEVLLEALDALDARVGRALHKLAHQPETPPVSMC